MGVGAGLYMYVVVLQKFTFAISSPDEFLLCMLPMSVARSSGMLTIGRIAYRREGGDGSSQRWRSVVYGCLVIFVICSQGHYNSFAGHCRCIFFVDSLSHSDWCLYYVDENCLIYLL